MTELGIVLDFKSKTITIDEITLPMRNINLLQGASMLRALKLNNSLAKEPLSTLDATKRVTRILDVKYAKADLQSIVKNNCKHLSANHQKKLLQLLVKFELLIDGTLGDLKTKPVSFQLKEGASPMAELPQYQKFTKRSSSKKLRDCANWGYLSDSTIQNGHCHLL
jgi:hypothetical protein